ncbi:MAG: hypothetical protein NC910_00830 [Candidatus Omnitrophica bacterium]|nr:hypothetical protein [Candidatus Omnitrophota bacterium]
MQGALDDSPLVAEVLLDRVLKMSRKPEREAVVLVAHGPESMEDNASWLAVMQRLGGAIQTKGRFSELALATLQDDAPPEIREQATRPMRWLVQELGQTRKVSVVPLFLSRGGIEEKIVQRLEGLSCVFSGETLLPHPKISKWIQKEIQSALTALEGEPL